MRVEVRRTWNGYHVDLTINIPVEIESDQHGAYDMVFRSSGYLHYDAY